MALKAPHTGLAIASDGLIPYQDGGAFLERKSAQKSSGLPESLGSHTRPCREWAVNHQGLLAG